MQKGIPNIIPNVTPSIAPTNIANPSSPVVQLCGYCFRRFAQCLASLLFIVFTIATFTFKADIVSTLRTIFVTMTFMSALTLYHCLFLVLNFLHLPAICVLPLLSAGLKPCSVFGLDESYHCPASEHGR